MEAPRGEEDMALKADLYLDKVDPLRYLTTGECDRCGSASCAQWLEKLRTGQAKPDQCPSLGADRAHALEVVLSLARILPDVEITQHPVAGPAGLQEINEPGPDAPVLVTGNALITQEVVMAVLSTTDAPFHVLFVDCRGHTVDMAMIYRTFTPEAIFRAIQDSKLASVVAHRELILPGLAAPLKQPLDAHGQWRGIVGPVCVGELPLFLGTRWRRPASGAHIAGP